MFLDLITEAMQQDRILDYKFRDYAVWFRDYKFLVVLQKDGVILLYCNGVIYKNTDDNTYCGCKNENK